MQNTGELLGKRFIATGQSIDPRGKTVKSDNRRDGSKQADCGGKQRFADGPGDHFEASRMSAHWENPELWYALVFLVWGGMVAEIRLMMTMSEVKVEGNEQSMQQEQTLFPKNGMPNHQYVD